MNIPLNIDWQQILLHFFNFSILTGGLYLLLYKPVKDFMEKREEHYRALDASAQEALAQAQEKLKAADARAAALDDELAGRRAAAAKEAEELAERQRAAAQAQAEKLLSDARAQAEREREEIVSDANREAVSIAEAAMDKLAGEAYESFLTSVEGEKGA